MSFNRVIISGRLTDNPRVSSSQNGVLIGNFSLAVNEFFNNQERTSFFDCVAFSGVAERLDKYCQKGSLVLVEGSIRQERWESKDGVKKNKVAIVVQRFEIFDKRKTGEEGQASPSNQSFSQVSSNKNELSENTYFDLDNEIPF